MRVEINADGIDGLADALTAASKPSRLGRRGAALWAEMLKLKLDPIRLVLAEEMCRAADRLEQLDRLLSGDAEMWAFLVHDLRTEDYVLKIDGAAVEARNLQNTYRQMLATLLAGVDTKPAEALVDPLNEIQKARAAREAKRAAGA